MFPVLNDGEEDGKGGERDGDEEERIWRAHGGH